MRRQRWDTTFVSELARPVPDASVVDRLAQWRTGRPSLPRCGTHSCLAPSGCHWHARQRAELSAAGRSPAFADTQIAAIAVAQDLRLATRNVADFADFADLTVENWFG